MKGSTTGGTGPPVCSPRSSSPASPLAGAPGGGDLITFTANLSNSYTQISATTYSDGFGPYAYAGAYLTPYQMGDATVAGRTLGGEDQQNGLHLISCERFTVSRVTGRNLWESPVKCGTGFASTSLTDGCSQGAITDCTGYHAFDQGVSLWVSDHITVRGCQENAAGWAGMSMTASDFCTVIANVILESFYAVPTNTIAGCGVALGRTAGAESTWLCSVASAHLCR
jgi:hypothetical protein